MPEITLTSDDESVIEVVSQSPQEVVIRLSAGDPGTGEEVQVIRNPDFFGEGNWRRGEEVVIYEWENDGEFPNQATNGNGKGRPVAITDPPASVRFKAQEHTPIKLDDGPIPYGESASVSQRIVLSKSYTSGRLAYRQVAHFDKWEEADFKIIVDQYGNASEFSSIAVVSGFEYVESPDPNVQLWQDFEHKFSISPDTSELVVTIYAKMPSNGQTGTKISGLKLFLS